VPEKAKKPIYVIKFTMKYFRTLADPIQKHSCYFRKDWCARQIIGEKI